MKLVVENCPERERFLREAFNITCNQLGIAAEEGTVTVILQSQSLMCPLIDGQTMTITTDGQFLMYLSSRLLKEPLLRLAQVFCHELVHVKQMIKDGLRGGEEGIVYKGELYPIVALAFASILPIPVEPWEVEAYSRDVELAETVMQYASHKGGE